MAHDILDPSALISSVPSLLSVKRLENPQDGIAVLLHAALIAVGFRLIATDDSSPAQFAVDNILTGEWNRHGPGNYTFRYRHGQSSLEFIVKIVKLGTRTVVNAIAVESDKAASLDISTDDFVSPSFYPHDLSLPDASPLVHGFISSNRVTDLIAQFKLKIIQKLVPGLRKDGYSEEADETIIRAGGSNAPRRNELPPSRPHPHLPPHTPDEDYYNHPLRILPENPLQIGRQDLDPIPMNPFTSPPLFPRHGNDGMFVGPNHPIFGQGRGRMSGEGGPWGGDGYLPPMGAPPGARFDPVGPGLGPFPGRVGLGRGLPGSGNMRSPDNDEFMPPGARDMFM